MSSQYINQNSPQHQISGRLNNLVIDGAQSNAGDLTINGNTTLKKVTFSPAPVLYTQTTSAGSAVNISGAEECFDINTFALTTSAGGIEAFNITHSGVNALDSVQLTQISYAGDYNVNGALVAHVAAVSASVVTIGIKNWGSGSANGAMKLRFKLFHNSA